jgi:hypothetical protein
MCQLYAELHLILAALSDTMEIYIIEEKEAMSE